MTPPPPADPPAPASFGAYIKAERQRQQLSIRQLAALVGTVPSMVLRWERDETVPKAKYLGMLSRSLELPINTLRRLSGDEYAADIPSLPAMLRAEYDLPPEAIAEIEQHITDVTKRYAAAKDGVAIEHVTERREQ
jgi:transcriptional regulator with XRE-family HTH domain